MTMHRYAAGLAVGVWKEMPEQEGAMEYSPTVSLTYYFRIHYSLSAVRLKKKSERRDWRHGGRLCKGLWTGHNDIPALAEGIGTFSPNNLLYISAICSHKAYYCVA